MQALWKLPPYELSPTDDGGWAVQSEEGLGSARAVFIPLHKAGGTWAVAIPDPQDVALTPVNDQTWTPVPFPPAPRATHFLCVLLYDQPADRPGNSYFRVDLVTRAGATLPSSVTGAELREGLASVVKRLDGNLDLAVVPAPAHAGAAPAALPLAPGAGPAMAGLALRDLSAPLLGLASVQAAPKSAPAPAPDGFCFAFASCQYPAGLLDRPVAHRSFERLADWLQQPHSPVPERLLLLGDQVYTDATYGLVDPVRTDDRYRIPYEDFTNRENGPFSSLPQAFLGRRRMTADDHEIRDNWEPTGRRDPGFAAGVAAYWKYQRRVPQKRWIQMTESGPGWRLFMADSRTKREERKEGTAQQALILGKRQTCHLERWLLAGRERQPGALNIVSCASMILPRTRIDMDQPLYLDAWQGYPASLERLLAFVCDHGLENLVFLGGDAHLACDARVEVVRRKTDSRGEARVKFASLHAPALYSPYPFANEETWNLLLDEVFTFSWGGSDYDCTVQAKVLAGGRNGCGLLCASQAGGGWNLGYQVLEPAPVPA